MELTDLNREQKEALISWLKDGLTLSKLQKKLVASFSLHITYMELRLLVDDLNIDLKEYEVEKPSQKTCPLNSSESIGQKSSTGVSVYVEKIARPGALISGTVIFSDGKSIEWQLDSLGQLGLISADQEYQPPSEDMPIFQEKIKEAIGKAQGMTGL